MIDSTELDNDKNIDAEFDKISPFELKDRLIALADESIRKNTHIMLNAGRGNPNWVATEAREAFFALGPFAINEARNSFNLPEGIAGTPIKTGIATRFEEYLKTHEGEPGICLLKKFYNYMLMEHASDPDDLVKEWADSMLGDSYPVPDRILNYTEIIVRDYLNQVMCDCQPPEGSWFDLFATEGSTAGMCYVFDSLEENFLLHKGDSVALLVPAFTPYIEIPQLERYSYEVLNISADTMDKDGLHTWQYKPEDIYKLRDPKFKALFVINPSNPPSYQMDAQATEAIKDVVKNSNPNLMIITDDVYGSYVNGFRSLIADLPFNTMCLYSFSKYFGATGWRIAAIMLNKDNVFDKMISELPDAQKAQLDKRYSSITRFVKDLKFIDRMVADSRQVALNHTAGLGLPQQMQMSLFAASYILDKEKIYHTRILQLIDDRLKSLWTSMDFVLPPDPLRAGYYSEIDLLVWAKRFYGQEFVDYLSSNYNPLSLVFRLANETGLVVLNGGGFDGPQWSVRVSLANLNQSDYVRIGKSIRDILNTYADSWKASKTK